MKRSDRGGGLRLVKRHAEEMVSYFREEIAEGRIPTFSRAAERLGCSMGTLMRVCREREVFATAYEECRMLLVDHLIEGGLTKRLDASLVKLMLGELGGREAGGFGAFGGAESARGGGEQIEIVLRIESEADTVCETVK